MPKQNKLVTTSIAVILSEAKPLSPAIPAKILCSVQIEKGFVQGFWDDFSAFPQPATARSRFRGGRYVVGHDHEVAGTVHAINDEVVEQRLGVKAQTLKGRDCPMLVWGHLRHNLS
jgi:hypothetical protein